MDEATDVPASRSQAKAWSEARNVVFRIGYVSPQPARAENSTHQATWVDERPPA